MATSNESPSNAASELARRHKSTTTTVWSLLVAVILLAVMAFVSKRFLTQQINPSLDIAVRVSILIFGLGAITWRRTKFAAMRLQDIGALKGVSGLLITLQRTTIQVAIIGALIGCIGFAGTLLTGNEFYTYVAAVVGAVVIMYAYPVRSAWERAVQRFAPSADRANFSQNGK
jgi:uncharacterized membrane protein YeaQ/YmgE (transglycosylase-associated protein family)